MVRLNCRLFIWKIKLSTTVLHLGHFTDPHPLYCRWFAQRGVLLNKNPHHSSFRFHPLQYYKSWLIRSPSSLLELCNVILLYLMHCTKFTCTWLKMSMGYILGFELDFHSSARNAINSWVERLSLLQSPVLVRRLCLALKPKMSKAKEIRYLLRGMINSAHN